MPETSYAYDSRVWRSVPIGGFAFLFAFIFGLLYLVQYSSSKGRQSSADARNRQSLSSWEDLRRDWEQRATDITLQRKLIQDIAAGEQYVVDELEAAYEEHSEMRSLYSIRVIDEASYKKYFGKFKGTKRELELLAYCREKALQVMLARNGKLLHTWAMFGIPMNGDSTSADSMKALEQQLEWLNYIDSQLKAHSEIQEPLRFVLYRKDASGYHIVSYPDEARFSRGNFYWKPEMAPGVKH